MLPSDFFVCWKTIRDKRGSVFSRKEGGKFAHQSCKHLCVLLPTFSQRALPPPRRAPAQTTATYGSLTMETLSLNV